MSESNNQEVNDSGTQTELDLDDLDNFSDTFFGKEKSQDEPAKPSAEVEVEETPEDVPPDDNEDEAEESDDTPDETDDEPDKAPEGKKPSRSQQRITELNTKYREAERREQELLRRLEALENGSQKTDEPAPKQAVGAAPTPADKGEDGDDKYPLGEFDPNFIRDLTKYTIAEAQKEADVERQKTDAERTQRAEAERLTTEWQEKQSPARERYPDYAEKVASLEDVFSGIDESYGDYLAQTVMQMDKGPDVLYYLAENPDEARAIVKAGGVKAAIALGRLESRFLSEDKPQPKAKVSKAPTPPPTNKGSAGGRKTVAPDTDDLDAFAATFFKRR